MICDTWCGFDVWVFGWVGLPVLDFAELGRSAAWVCGSVRDFVQPAMVTLWFGCCWFGWFRRVGVVALFMRIVAPGFARGWAIVCGDVAGEPAVGPCVCVGVWRFWSFVFWGVCSVCGLVGLCGARWWWRHGFLL